MYFCQNLQLYVLCHLCDMKKILIALCASVLLMFSCQGNYFGKADDFATDTVDSVKTGTEETIPLAADELFDDFFFNFIANRKLQLSRIDFPVKVYQGRKVDSIRQRKWKMDSFFMKQGYYTLMFNSRREMTAMKDTAVNKAIVEKIYLDKALVKQFYFERERGLWSLKKIRHTLLRENTNASFLYFYRSFANDTAFQLKSLCNPVRFVGPDPDDEFSQMEGMIAKDTWLAFAPELPSKMLYNIVYGTDQKVGDWKIFVVRGIANGLEMELMFRRLNGKWHLYKLTT